MCLLRLQFQKRKCAKHIGYGSIWYNVYWQGIKLGSQYFPQMVRATTSEQHLTYGLVVIGLDLLENLEAKDFYLAVIYRSNIKTDTRGRFYVFRVSEFQANQRTQRMIDATNIYIASGCISSSILYGTRNNSHPRPWHRES